MHKIANADIRIQQLTVITSSQLKQKLSVVIKTKLIKKSSASEQFIFHNRPLFKIQSKIITEMHACICCMRSYQFILVHQNLFCTFSWISIPIANLAKAKSQCGWHRPVPTGPRSPGKTMFLLLIWALPTGTYHCHTPIFPAHLQTTTIRMISQYWKAVYRPVTYMTP